MVPRILALRSQVDRGVVVGISGPDCAGKSTFAEALRQELTRRATPTLLISGDEFTRPTSERYAEVDQALGYYRDSFDYGDLFERLLPAVRASGGAAVDVRSSDWESDRWRSQTITIEARSVAIVEGCFLYVDGRSDEFDLSIWIEVSPAISLSRALERRRDLERMGGPEGVRGALCRALPPGPGAPRRPRQPASKSRHRAQLGVRPIAVVRATTPGRPTPRRAGRRSRRAWPRPGLVPTLR